ncbi:MAG: hypothetical protein KME32_09705 [Mojavia pulchra JT2-VF2]|uniref:Uncharacterized protein n=1 Tax=Mojavia pulchra JT2-VF2 TaxID=287848 RepID=A0A951PY61_9NOST|nr:hypothetical protein [Mojavia pulchra JT2-VF2]
MASGSYKQTLTSSAIAYTLIEGDREARPVVQPNSVGLDNIRAIAFCYG